ncbi:homeobox protein MOX-1 [Sarcoptes scabiei]|nr:homeobox protein MOX-1 [Sarcoptes scabiei]
MATIQNGFSFLGELHHQQHKYPILAQPYNLQRELPKYFLNPIEITDQNFASEHNSPPESSVSSSNSLNRTATSIIESDLCGSYSPNRNPILIAISENGDYTPISNASDSFVDNNFYYPNANISYKDAPKEEFGGEQNRGLMFVEHKPDAAQFCVSNNLMANQYSGAFDSSYANSNNQINPSRFSMTNHDHSIPTETNQFCYQPFSVIENQSMGYHQSPLPTLLLYDHCNVSEQHQTSNEIVRKNYASANDCPMYKPNDQFLNQLKQEPEDVVLKHENNVEEDLVDFVHLNGTQTYLKNSTESFCIANDQNYCIQESNLNNQYNSIDNSEVESQTSDDPKDSFETIDMKEIQSRYAHQRFPIKLWNLANDEQFQAIQWSSDGKNLRISECALEMNLGVLFRTKKFSSFLRQLHLYGFRKVQRARNHQRSRSPSLEGTYAEYQCLAFQRNRFDLIKNVKRFYGNTANSNTKNNPHSNSQIISNRNDYSNLKRNRINRSRKTSKNGDDEGSMMIDLAKLFNPDNQWYDCYESNAIESQELSDCTVTIESGQNHRNQSEDSILVPFYNDNIDSLTDRSDDNRDDDFHSEFQYPNESYRQ